MVETILLKKKNEVFFTIEADYGILLEMAEHFSFFVPNYKFMRAYKSGQWDGKIRLLNLRTREIYVGLYDKIVEFAQNKGRSYSVICETNAFGSAGAKFPVDLDEVNSFVEYLNIHSKGKKITTHDFQVDGFIDVLENRRKILISPTASGKSLMIYLIARWVQENELESGQKIVVVVPTVALVEQLSKDFEDYSSASEWSVDDNVHKIYSGKEKRLVKDIIVTTWQSLVNMKKTDLCAVKCVIGDEAHTFNAKSLTTLMEHMVNTDWRIGVTGTLTDSKVNHLVLEGLFGEIRQLTTTKTLQDRGIVSDIDIKILSLLYPEPVRKSFAKVKYSDEIAFINTYEKRNNLIKNLALSLEGNTIVMFRMVSHGKALHKLISEKAHKKRKVFLIYGGTDVEIRESVREIVENETNAIIIASLGVFSTGVNIKNIHNIILAAPTKSKIKLLQTIGRGLRLSDNGIGLTFYDLVDNISWRKRRNMTLNHGAERIKMYVNEGFKYTIYEIKL
jgi:superfamily II DNA or RNA helicase